MPELIENPLTTALGKTWSLLGQLDFSVNSFVPSAITGLVILLVLGVELALWPYGWMPVISNFLMGFVEHSKAQIQGAQSLIEKMPFTVALGIYFLIWVPFAIVCLPFYLVGALGKWITTIE